MLGLVIAGANRTAPASNITPPSNPATMLHDKREYCYLVSCHPPPHDMCANNISRHKTTAGRGGRGDEEGTIGCHQHFPIPFVSRESTRANAILTCVHFHFVYPPTHIEWDIYLSAAYPVRARQYLYSIHLMHFLTALDTWIFPSES